MSSKVGDVKLEYLVSQKLQLELELVELRQNNQMLRTVNLELSRN